MRINKYMKNNMQHLRLEECNIYAEIDTNSIPMEVLNDEDLIDLLVEFLPVKSGKEILEYRDILLHMRIVQCNGSYPATFPFVRIQLCSSRLQC